MTTQKGAAPAPGREFVTQDRMTDCAEVEAQRDRLRDALRSWRCDNCRGGTFDHHTGAGTIAECNHDGQHRYCPCRVCDGTGLHPTARAALTDDPEGEPYEAAGWSKGPDGWEP